MQVHPLLWNQSALRDLFDGNRSTISLSEYTYRMNDGFRIFGFGLGSASLMLFLSLLKYHGQCIKIPSLALQVIYSSGVEKFKIVISIIWLISLPKHPNKVILL